MYHSFPFNRRSDFVAKFLLVVTINLLLTSTTIPARAQGFGGSKMEVELHLYRPPKVFLEDTDIAIEVTAQKNISLSFQEQMQQLLERLLPSRDSRLTVVPDKPETVIACEITELTGSSRAETRQTTEYKKTGERTEYDQSTNTYTTVEEYGYVTETFSVTVVEGYISAIYQCTDAKTGDMIDSDTFALSHHKEYRQGYGYGSPAPAEPSLIESVVSGILSRFTPSTQASTSFLPKGKLKGISKLLQRKMWNSALEALASMRQFKEPHREAYRAYSTAIAYEGLSNDAPDLESRKFYLEKAVSFYNEARLKNPDEEQFKWPTTRAEMSLAGYRSLEAPMLAYEAKLKRRAATVAADPKADQPPPPVHGSRDLDPATITNDTVTGWVRAGVSEKEIRSRIKRAKLKRFDLSAGDVSNLLAAGVTARTVDEMRNDINNRRPQGKWGGRIAVILLYALYYAPYFLR